MLLISFWGSAQDHGPNQMELRLSYDGNANSRMQLDETDSLITWQERVLLHIDHTTIDKNRPLFFKGYVLTGPNRVRATLSKVLKVDLLQKRDSAVVATQYHKIKNGMTEGSVALPDKLVPGRYILRAYTRWMENYGPDTYFTQELSIPSGKEGSGRDIGQNEPTFNLLDHQVRFYPEGGQLVAGLENRLLIKAVNNEGETFGFEGSIVNSKGDEISPVTVFENGIMTAYFTPDPKEHYRLKTSDSQSFDLPNAIEAGYLLHVNNLNAKVLSLRVQVSPDLGEKPVWMKGRMNGITYFEKKLEFEAPVTTLEIPKSGIPFGILDISISDDSGQVWTRRPVFIDPNNALNITVIPLDRDEKEHERAFRVRVTNPDGSPVQTSLALSATHTIGIQGFDSEDPVADFLWEMHGADLPGSSTFRTDRFIKDLELLTSAQAGRGGGPNIPSRITYPFQTGLELVGYAYDLNNKLLRNTELQLLINTADDVIIREVQTDASGKLEVDNLQLKGETEMIFRTQGEDTSTRLVKVIPVQEAYDQDHKRKAILAFEKQRYRETIISSPWEPLDSEELVELDAVEVFDQKIERPRSMPPTYGMEAIKSRTAVQDLERPRFLFQLFAEIPGISISGGTADAPTITVNSTNSYFSSAPNSFGSALDQPGPLWVIDGFIWGNSPGVDPAMGLDAWSIDRIEFFIGAEASIYGSRAGNGVIMVYTRNGSELEYINRKEGRLYFQGYKETPDFESYSTLLAKKPRRFNDQPTTVYWNPEIQTNENGEAVVRFKLPFETNKLRIKASAITPKGEIASVQQYFE